MLCVPLPGEPGSRLEGARLPAGVRRGVLIGVLLLAATAGAVWRLGGERPAADTAAALAPAVAAWIAATTELPLPPAMPRIAFATRQELAEIYFGPAAASRGKIEAIYDGSARRIILADDWTGATRAETSVLVHEMVHHMQAATGRKAPCPAAREAAAYAAQERWLGMFGGSLEADFRIDPLTLFVRTRCGD